MARLMYQEAKEFVKKIEEQNEVIKEKDKQNAELLRQLEQLKKLIK